MAVCAVLMAVGCGGKSSSGCHIVGTVDNPELNGKRIFLVPLTDSRMEVVDSIEIKDGKFEFTRDTVMMAKVVVDYHYRMNVQPLLVVCEPGEVNVSIGAISSASGTPLNDSLQHWKDATERHQAQMADYKAKRQALEEKGDKAVLDSLRQTADSQHLQYRRYSRDMAAALKGTVLGDFLAQQFPKTYKRQYHDGMIVEFDADTNQPIDTLQQADRDTLHQTSKK